MHTTYSSPLHVHARVEVLHLHLKVDLVLGGLVNDLVEDEVLLAEVRHAQLLVLPLLLPEFGCEGLVLGVDVGLPVAHLEDLVDRFFLHLLLFGCTVLG